MAIAVLFENPDGSKEQYEDFSRKMFGGQLTPSEPIQGLIVHTAGAGKTGWRIFDAWESKADYERFMEQYVMPAMEGMGDVGDMPEPDIYELANVVITGVGVTA